MNGYSKYGILISILLMLSIFTMFSISEVQAAENFSVTTYSFENTIIFELDNVKENTSNVKTVRLWLSTDNSFKSFKSESGWGGGKYSDGQLLIFTASDALKPGEVVKFGVITEKKASGINWKLLNAEDEQIGLGKSLPQEISQETSIIKEDTKMIEEIKETGDILYGTKKFIPEKFRINSNLRFVGNGFNSEQTLQFYLDSILLKSTKTNEQGNFITTLHIPDTISTGTSEFIIKNEYGDLQSTTVNISEAKNRFLRQIANFEISDIPKEIRLGDTLSISGNGPPLSSVILTINNEHDVTEKIRVLDINSNGNWIYEELITNDEVLGTKKYLLKNNQNHILRDIEFKSDKILNLFTAATRYSHGDTVTFTGNGEPNKDLTLYVKDPNGKIIHFDVVKIDATGEIQYEYSTDDTFLTGTYVMITKQENESDAHLFGIGQYPTNQIVVLTDKINYLGTGSTTVFINIIGPPTTTLQLTVIDPSDNTKLSDVFTTNSVGEYRYELDTTGYSTGVYRAVVSKANLQDSIKFAVGVQTGSGDISLTPLKTTYLPGEQLVISGFTQESDSILTVSLVDPLGNTVSEIEIFSDSSGSFSTDVFGIPTAGEIGDWKITIHSNLDTAESTVTVSETVGNVLSIDIEEKNYSPGVTLLIQGTAPTTVSNVDVKIMNSIGEMIIELESPITGNGSYSLPWIIPSDLPFGVYTIEVNAASSSESTQIDII
ncbi:MG2 domain protein [Marine Group I thaumarchaeote SCGC AAA799-O18]|nr:MG2 domain protein [Marine Group I thaumarchaeote SCGC AAA799-O18]